MLENDITPQVQVLEGKQGKDFSKIKPRWYSLNFVEEFVSNSVLIHFPHDMSCVGWSNFKLQIQRSMDYLGLTRFEQNLFVKNEK